MSQQVETEPRNSSRREEPVDRREGGRSWFREHPKAVWGIAAVLAIAAIGGLLAWLHYRGRESTDDARIDGHIAPVSARVGGYITEILVDENQIVSAGQVLARIDDSDYRVALNRARAEMTAQEAAASAARTQVPIAATQSASGLRTAQSGRAEAEAGVSAADAAIREAQARVAAAQANLRSTEASRDRALADEERYRRLVEKDEISRQQYDAAATTARSAQAAVQSAQAAVAQAQTGVAAAGSQRAQALAKVGQAEAQVASAATAPQQVAVSGAQARAQEANADVRRTAVEQARLNLEYTVIKAPIGGLVGRRSVQIGQNVQPGQALFSIVEITDLWVTALFKETQLKSMRPGQPAEIDIDAFGGARMRGHVDSIGAATGGTFSVLPPENASGNYVKVVQRVPVKIVFEPNQPLREKVRPGMSVTPTVFTR